MTIEIPCLIQVDKIYFVSKDFKLTKDKEKALTIFGRHRAKKMALILQKNGIKHVQVIVHKM